MRIYLVTLLLAGSGQAWAHGGGLDSKGCHTEKRTGQYHCHRAQQVAPIRPALQTVQGGARGVEYANCSEARATGAAPVRRGDPGYSRKLDRDGDGVGCE